MSDFLTEIEARQLRQLHLIKQFPVNSIDRINAEKRTVSHFRNWLKLLESYWTKFTADDALLAPYITEHKEKDYFKNECFFESEEAYIGAKSDIQEELSKALRDSGAQLDENQELNTQGNDVPPHMSHSTPKIPIPDFDGTQENWDRWKDLFTAVVINTKASDAIKLQHLLNSVHGPAKVALGGISVTTSKFQVA